MHMLSSDDGYHACVNLLTPKPETRHPSSLSFALKFSNLAYPFQTLAPEPHMNPLTMRVPPRCTSKCEKFTKSLAFILQESCPAPSLVLEILSPKP
jgi:hypothetical protein